MVRPIQRIPPLALALVLVLAGDARAGMPSLTLTDLARLRFEAISFFLAGFLASTWGVRAIWNGLRKDFPRLPRLSFGRALALVGMWGMLFLLVLTMISGARELMTPGAWKKQGLTYKLAGTATTPTPPESDADRRIALDLLRAALWRYADAHDGQFPPDQSASGIAADLWRLPEPSGLRYVYVPGLKVDAGAFPLAYEPGLFGPERWTLLADGSTRPMTLDAIRRATPSAAGSGR